MVRSNIPSSMTVRDDTTLSGVTPGTVTASKAVVVDASNDITTGLNDLTVDGAFVTAALTVTPVARTATGTGATTGTIADAGSYQVIAVTSTSANDIIILPTPTPGTVIDLYGGASGYEIRSSAPGSVEIGDGTVAATAESAIPALSAVHLTCISATLWVGWMVVDSTLAAVPGAAA
jgi:hypothetical protein